MRFQQKVEELHQFLETWSKEVRSELKLGDLPEQLLRDVLEPSNTARLASGAQVPTGVYSSNDHDLQVNVISQDPQTGLIVVEITYPTTIEERFQTMSPGIFFALFQPTDLESLRKKELLEFYQQHGIAEPDAQLLHHEERIKCFSSKYIEKARADVGRKLHVLDTNLYRADTETLKADFLELLFLVFVLGARIGFSPRHEFHSLYGGVCSLVDGTIEQCALTRKYYEDQGIETGYQVYELYDPVIEVIPPTHYYITFSSKDQVAASGMAYPKGCFLPTQRMVKPVHHF